MSVLRPDGLMTTSAGLTRIRRDRINAQRQIDDHLRSKSLFFEFSHCF